MFGGPGIGGAAALMVTALLVGCSSDAGGTVALPSLTSTPARTSTTTSGSPTPSANPKAEVEAAVRAYFDAFDLATRTGVVDTYLERTTPKCTCRSLATLVRDEYRVAPLIGAGVELKRVSVDTVAPVQATATVTYRTKPYSQSRPEGTRLVDGATVGSFLRLELTSGTWLVADEDILSRTAT